MADEQNTFQIEIESSGAETALQRMQEALQALTTATTQAGTAFDRMVAGATASLTQLGTKLDETMTKLQALGGTAAPVPVAAQPTTPAAVPQQLVAQTPVTQVAQATAIAAPALERPPVEEMRRLAESAGLVVVESEQLAASEGAIGREGIAAGQKAAQGMGEIGASAKAATGEVAGLNAEMRKTATPAQTPTGETFEQMQARVQQESRVAREAREATQVQQPVAPIAPVVPPAPTPVETPAVDTGQLALASRIFEETGRNVKDTREALVGMGYSAREAGALTQQAVTAAAGATQNLSGETERLAGTQTQVASTAQQTGGKLSAMAVQGDAGIKALKADVDALNDDLIKMGSSAEVTRSKSIGALGQETTRTTFKGPEGERVTVTESEAALNREMTATAMTTARNQAATGQYAAALDTLSTAAQRAGLSQRELEQIQSQVIRTQEQAIAAANKQAMAGMDRPQRIDYLRAQSQSIERQLSGGAERVVIGQNIEVSPELAQKVKASADAQIAQFERVEREGSNAYRSLGSLVTRQLERILVGMAIWETFRTVSTIIRETIAAMEQYSIEVARFAAVTDQSIAQATQQYNTLRDTIARGGFTPTEAAPTIVEAGRMAKTPQGQQQLVTAATGLAELLGQKDPQKTIEAINEGLLAMGQDASQAAQMADLIAAAYKQAGGSADEFLSAATDAATISDKIGLSFDKTLSVITGGAAASGRSIGTVFQTLNRMSESLDKMPTNKLLTIVEGLKALGIQALDAQGNLRPIGEIIDDLGQRFGSLTGAQQEQAIALLFGGEKVRGQAYAAAKGIMESYGKGLSDGFQDAAGTVAKGLALIDSTFGQAAKRFGARMEALRQEGGGIPAWFQQTGFDISTAAGYITGGAGGARKAALAEEIGAQINQQGVGLKQTLLEQLSQLPKDEAVNKIQEYNDAIVQAINYGYGAGIDTTKLIIKLEDVEAFQKAGQNAGKGFIGGLMGAIQGFSPRTIIDSLTQDIQNAVQSAKDKEQKSAARFDTTTPRGRLGLEVYQYQQRLGTAQEEASPLAQAQQVDLTKYSQQQINQLKAMSVQLSMQEIQALQAELQLLGMSSDEISKIVTQKQKELQASLAIIQSQQGLQYQQGLEVANIQKAAQLWDQERQRREKAQKAEESNFAFQRLQNITPEQFPQLQALTAYYNSILTKLGSPEKQQNINLMLGEGQDSVFKTLTSRMTALQLALEDLNKTEKAQLAGTWNLPAGATALVPIQSLDLQRWNKQGGGGGIDAAALMALAQQIDEQNKKEGKVAQMAGATGGNYDGGMLMVTDPVTHQLLAPIDKMTTAIQMAFAAQGKTITAEQARPIAEDAKSAAMSVIAMLFGEAGQAVKPSATMPTPPRRDVEETRYVGRQATLPTAPVRPTTAPTVATLPTVPPVSIAPIRPPAIAATTPVMQTAPSLVSVREDTRLQSLSNSISLLVGSVSRLSNLGGGRMGLSAGGGATPPTATPTDIVREVGAVMSNYLQNIQQVLGKPAEPERPKPVEGRMESERYLAAILQQMMLMSVGMRGMSMAMMPTMPALLSVSMSMNYHLTRIEMLLGATTPTPPAARATQPTPTARMTALTTTERRMARVENVQVPRATESPTGSMGQTNQLLSSLVTETRSNRLLTSNLARQNPILPQPANDIRREMTRPQQINVEVSMMPLRATFNANLTVMLNAAVVARAVFPLLYKELVRVSRGSATGLNYIGTVR